MLGVAKSKDWAAPRAEFSPMYKALGPIASTEGIGCVGTPAMPALRRGRSWCPSQLHVPCEFEVHLGDKTTSETKQSRFRFFGPLHLEGAHVPQCTHRSWLRSDSGMVASIFAAFGFNLTFRPC